MDWCKELEFLVPSEEAISFPERQPNLIFDSLLVSLYFSYVVAKQVL